MSLFCTFTNIKYKFATPKLIPNLNIDLKTKIKIYGSVVLAMIFWAFSFLWFKVANETFHPVTIVFLRLLFSVIIMTVFLLVTKNYMKIRKADRKLFLMLALFEPFFYFLGESFGLTYVSATVCSVMISTIPVVATIGAWLIFKEKLKTINYMGIILSFIGVLVFILNSDGSISFNSKGLGFLSLAVVSAVGYNLTLSRLVGTYSPVYIVNVQNIIGAVLFMPIFFIFDFKHFSTVPLTFEYVQTDYRACYFVFLRSLYSVRLFRKQNGDYKGKCILKLYPCIHCNLFIYADRRKADSSEYSRNGNSYCRTLHVADEP